MHDGEYFITGDRSADLMAEASDDGRRRVFYMCPCGCGTAGALPVHNPGETPKARPPRDHRPTIRRRKQVDVLDDAGRCS